MRSALQDEIRELRTRYWSDRDPSGRAFAPLADAYRRAGELDEAAELIEEGVSRLPEYVPGHLVAARILRDRGDRTGAVAAYERVLELDPENLEALRGAARLREEAGRTGEALELWQRLLRAEPADLALTEHVREVKRRHFGLEGPDDAPVRNGGSGEADASGSADEPEEETKARDATDPGEDESEELYTRTMAELYARQGLPERALAVYRKLLAAEPDDAALRSRLEELERQMAEESQEAEAPSGTGADVGDEDPAPRPAGDAGGGRDVGDDAPREAGEVGGAARPPTPESTAGAYFRRMLAWPDVPEPEA